MAAFCFYKINFMVKYNLILLLIISIISCKKKESEIKGDQAIYVQDMQIPPNSTLYIPFVMNLAYNYSNQQYGTNINISNYNHAYPKAINISIMSPEGINFNFIQKIEVWMKTDSLSRRIAVIDEMPNNYNLREINVYPIEIDVIELLKQPNFNFQVKYIAKSVLNYNIECRNFVTFVCN